MFNPKIKHKFLDEAEQYGAKRLVDSVKRSRGGAAKPALIGLDGESSAMPEVADEMPGELAEGSPDTAKLTPEETAQLRRLLAKMC